MDKELRKMGRTEAQKRANAKYYAKAYEKVSFDSRKELRLTELTTFAAEKKGISKAQYIAGSILSQLARDGITIDMLPTEGKYTPPSEPKQSKQYMIYLVTQWMMEDGETSQSYIDHPEWFFENYVSIFQTEKGAKDYIKNKYKRKAYPEQWGFTIYGRSFEANTKLEAFDMYKRMVKESIAEADDMLENGEDGALIKEFIQILNEKQAADYVEVVWCRNTNGDFAMESKIR